MVEGLAPQEASVRLAMFQVLGFYCLLDIN